MCVTGRRSVVAMAALSPVGASSLRLRGAAPARRTRGRCASAVRAAAAAGDVPDMGKRSLMNALLLGAIGAPTAALAGGFAYFFVPPSCVPFRSHVHYYCEAAVEGGRERRVGYGLPSRASASRREMRRTLRRRHADRAAAAAAKRLRTPTATT